MLRTRIIPCLQLLDDSLVKTVKFSNPQYIGDPINTVRIFNELEVDELCFLDIRATQKGRLPDFELLKNIADECFMPLSYGGGINSLEVAERIFQTGFEKVVLNTAAYRTPEVITQIAKRYGSQAVVGSIDVKKDLLGRYHVYVADGIEKIKVSPVDWAKQLEAIGAGELLVTSMDKDGTWGGYDTMIIERISEAVKIPVIANGGAGDVKHFKSAINAKASALAIGSMVVYQKKGMGVLINFPDKLAIAKEIA